MNQGRVCVSICDETAHGVLGRIERVGHLADVIEIRFDCLRPEEIGRLFGHLQVLGRQVLVTLRPFEQGGKRQLTMQQRVEFWQSALPRLGGLDFQIDREFDLELPFEIDPNRVIVSRHDFGSPGKTIELQVDALDSVAGRTIKIAIAIDNAVDAIQVWKLIGKTKKSVIPIAMGEAGKWTRILGLAHGAPMTYASLDSGDETAPGQLSALDLRDVYRVKELDEATGVYGVIAGDTSYSLSPYMHNAAFKHAEINSVFIPLQVRDLDGFMRRMVIPETREIVLNFRGFSVTNPHKQAIMKHLDFIDETAQKIGAVNTVKVENGKLSGYNTDANGFIQPLKKLHGDLSGARVAIAGAGGAARACLHALMQEGAEVTLLARDLAKAKSLANEFGIRSGGLLADGVVLTADILVNATPLGTRGEDENQTVATSGELRSVGLVYDLVYNPARTRLRREAETAGVKSLGGIEMLIAQGANQFEIWTGEKAPVREMQTAIEERLT